MPLKIAVVGCGRVARGIHLPNLRNLPDVTVSAVVDPDPSQRAQALKICPKSAAFERLDQVWDAMSVDAALISAPTTNHAALVAEAIDRGVHVYAEKPLAADLAEAEGVVSAWKGGTALGMIGFNYRFHPLYAQARRLLSEDAVGRPLMVSTVFCSSNSSVNDWRARRRSGGGVLLDLGSHHVDLVHFLLAEEMADVHAQTSSTHAEHDTATLQMRLRNGVLVSSMFSYGSTDTDRIEIFGDRGILRVDRYLSTTCEIVPRHKPRARLRQLNNALSFLWRPGAVLSKRTPGGDPSYRVALEQFVQSVRSGTPCTPDFADGLRALQVISAAERSAREGRWVEMAAAGGASV